METLPDEIADKILNLIFYQHPRGLYGLRCVSKSWKDMIDRCTARLLKVWCRKCSDELPENILDDFIQMRLSESWKKYCVHKQPMPHIARDICESRNEMPNLVGKAHFTEIGPPSKIQHKSIDAHAVSDDYFAISFLMGQGKEEKSVVRIYSLDDPASCIREYQIPCKKIDFYIKNCKVFIVLQKDYSNGSSVFLAEFLVNENLIPANLPSGSYDMRYTITKNQCFTFKWFKNLMIQHQQLTPNGFESRKAIQVPHLTGNYEFTFITNIQICNSNLFVFVSCRHKNGGCTLAVCKFQITREPDDQLSFSDPIVFKKKFSVREVEMSFGTDNFPLRNSIRDLYPRKLKKWLLKFFDQREVYEIIIYAHHLLLTCSRKVIVFRGSFRELMDHAGKETDPGSKCTAIDVSLIRPIAWNGYHARVINIKSKPQFLIITKWNAAIINFIP